MVAKIEFMVNVKKDTAKTYSSKIKKDIDTQKQFAESPYKNKGTLQTKQVGV